MPVKCNIKIILVKRGISQKEFAEIMGVSQQQMNNWVSGKPIPKMETLLKMSDILDCSINDFYELVEE
ncbi:helix-turn-helix domain-containing protein [Oceanobacillus caeni]|uniref:helix-turn-helix transcriptional regulator n=1 Tax=Oceanobacillus caeni TaxID=405946 RepID=UPI002149A63D|nr:helix-turn-helix transcriptional regulator [Oceanobacillus caeni]MCR1833126.1 helix-turn-helix domain-containing protein [Oceanobacillus caeni]